MEEQQQVTEREPNPVMDALVEYVRAEAIYQVQLALRGNASEAVRKNYEDILRRVVAEEEADGR